jgi:MftR C-terminal domain
VLLPAVERMQAERDLWILRMRVIANNPALLPALFARGGDKEQQLIAAIAKRTGLGPESDFPPLVAAVTGAAFRTAMIRWAAGDGARSLSDYVHEAFGMVAAGLTEPVSPTTTPTSKEL